MIKWRHLRSRTRRAARRLNARAPWWRPPSSSLVICGMPRSGTSLLAGLVASTRLVGYPVEYFNPAKQAPSARDDYPAFVATTVSGNARNGVFGVKFIGRQLLEFVSVLRSLPGNGMLDDRALVESVLPSPRYVWVTRRDLVAQAVSLWKARQTGVWWVSHRDRPAPAPADVVFDFEGIERYRAVIVRGNERWEAWFAENKIEPLRVVYEDLDENPVEVTRRVLDFLGVDVPRRRAIKVGTSRQSGPLDAEWIARYRMLAASRGLSKNPSTPGGGA